MCKRTYVNVKVKLSLHMLYFRNITPVFGEALTNRLELPRVVR